MAPPATTTSDPDGAEPAEDDAAGESAGAGEIDLAPEFLQSFEDLLTRERIEVRFFSGAWASFVPVEPYDLVLTSETVYELASLDSLVALLDKASFRGDKTECLVACKRIYFGVGGGELEFRRRCEERGAGVATAWGEGEGQGRKGVGRVVMKVQWQ